MQVEAIERDRGIGLAVPAARWRDVVERQQGPAPLPAQLDGGDIDVGVDAAADALGQGVAITRHEMVNQPHAAHQQPRQDHDPGEGGHQYPFQ